MSRYQHMPYRRCGNSGLKLPAISLGLWHNFGANAAAAQTSSLIHRAFDLGITHFDLANNYGPPPGASEETFGRILDDGLRAHRDELVISTKAGFLMWEGPYGEWGSRKSLLSSLDQSLRRMRLEYVDVFYHHRPDPETPLEETMGAIADAVRWGKALYAGISNYPPDMTTRAAAILKDLGVPLLIHQMRYNMVCREAEEGGLLDVLEAEGVGGIAFCPLAQGLLTNRYLDGVPSDARVHTDGRFLKTGQITPTVLSRTRGLNAIAQRRGQTLAQMAVAWTLRNPVMASALIGASKPEQIEENVSALENLEFTDEELGEIAATTTNKRGQSTYS